MDPEGPRTPRDAEAETGPAKTPYLHVRSVEGMLFEEAIAITGNARALLQLRAQIDRRRSQAAEFLKRSRSWVRTKAREGKIPRYAHGGEGRYHVYDLLDFILQGE